MKVRYCQTPLQNIFPCPLMWGTEDKDGIRGCGDVPMAANCGHIIETDNLRCPVCGGKITMEIISKQVDRFDKAWKSLAKQ